VACFQFGQTVDSERLVRPRKSLSHWADAMLLRRLNQYVDSGLPHRCRNSGESTKRVRRQLDEFVTSLPIAVLSGEARLAPFQRRCSGKLRSENRRRKSDSNLVLH